jgi:stress response protein YsnF
MTYHFVRAKVRGDKSKLFHTNRIMASLRRERADFEASGKASVNAEK